MIDTVIGKNITRMRQIRYLTVENLANLLDSTSQEIQHYEAGKKPMLPALLKQCSELFGCSIQDFFYDSEKPFEEAEGIRIEDYKLQYMIKDFLSISDSPAMQEQIKNVVNVMVKTHLQQHAGV